MNAFARQLSLCALLAGCWTAAPSTATPEKTAPRASAADQFVLVWFDAPFYRSPTDPTPVRQYDFGSEGRVAHPGQGYVMRVLEDRGEWLRVVDTRDWLQPGSNLGVHCLGSGAFWVQSFAIELWVRSEDLMPVLAVPFEKTYSDGTFVKLLPGTPIVQRRPWVDGMWFPVTAPNDAIGRSYIPVRGDDTANPGFETITSNDATLGLGGAAVPLHAPPWDYAAVPAFSVSADRSRMFERNGCGSYLLSFQGHSSAGDGDSPDLLGVLASSGHVPGIEIPVGTTLYWPDGSRAGVTSTAFVQGGSQPSTEARTCLAIPLGTELRTSGFRDARITVCVDSQAIRRVSAAPPAGPDVRSEDSRVKIVN
ncbi:MAG TPA: hypothetical protein VGM90_32860 [Kofleriaceae bacterium]|jgi:hypothetical protein